MTRTFSDHKKQAHTLELDAVQVDGVRCLAIQATEQDIEFELQNGEAVTCELAQFWRDIAGSDLDAREAGLLLADCLVRQLVLQRASFMLREAMSLLTRATALPAEIPSTTWLTTRLDPLARQAMSAYDGTPEMTGMLARILQQEPDTIRLWASQLGLDVPAPDIDVATEPLPVVETPAEAAQASEEPAEPSSEGKKFTWTPERLRELEVALETCTGSTVAERAKQVAGRCNWPVEKVRSKLYELQRQHRDSPQLVDAEARMQPTADNQRQESLLVSSQQGACFEGIQRLARGNFLWTVQCGTENYRWQLDYPYGAFPLVTGQHFLYGDQEYQIELAANSLIRIAAVSTTIQVSGELVTT